MKKNQRSHVIGSSPLTINPKSVYSRHFINNTTNPALYSKSRLQQSQWFFSKQRNIREDHFKTALEPHLDSLKPLSQKIKAQGVSQRQKCHYASYQCGYLNKIQAHNASEKEADEFSKQIWKEPYVQPDKLVAQPKRVDVQEFAVVVKEYAGPHSTVDHEGRFSESLTTILPQPCRLVRLSTSRVYRKRGLSKRRPLALHLAENIPGYLQLLRFMGRRYLITSGPELVGGRLVLCDFFREYTFESPMKQLMFYSYQSYPLLLKYFRHDVYEDLRSYASDDDSFSERDQYKKEIDYDRWQRNKLADETETYLKDLLKLPNLFNHQWSNINAQVEPSRAGASTFNPMLPPERKKASRNIPQQYNTFTGFKKKRRTSGNIPDDILEESDTSLTSLSPQASEIDNSSDMGSMVTLEPNEFQYNRSLIGSAQNQQWSWYYSPTSATMRRKSSPRSQQSISNLKSVTFDGSTSRSDQSEKSSVGDMKPRPYYNNTGPHNKPITLQKWKKKAKDIATTSGAIAGAKNYMNIVQRLYQPKIDSDDGNIPTLLGVSKQAMIPVAMPRSRIGTNELGIASTGTDLAELQKETRRLVLKQKDILNATKKHQTKYDQK